MLEKGKDDCPRKGAGAREEIGIYIFGINEQRSDPILSARVSTYWYKQI
jgi:hypothetical protein